ncbi:MAG: acetylornithine/succinylornithine family transaminase [Candidatus Kapabacteria bacterium]|nr:acetylornithine/succinylornithine family transaminase [Candidatus Kapabacteria bacterium]
MNKTRNELIEAEHKYFLQTYKRLDIVPERAEGCRIYDKNGDEYLDFLGGIAVNVLGHSHPRILEAISEQAKRYLHLSNYFYQDSQIELAEKLIKMTGYSRVFFSNSGTESTEGAIKLVRRLGNLNNKSEIIAFTGGFHGRTYGALSIMDKPLYKDNMGPFLEKIKILPYNDVTALKNYINKSTAAVFLEFIQGEGGIAEAKSDFVSEIFNLKEKYNFLVVADEIQAGIGRTGKFHSFEHYNVKPDVVTLAKGLGGGLPLGCILTLENLSDVWSKGMHGTTFGGNALACAVGSVVLEELESGLMNHVISVGDYLKQRLIRLQKAFPELILEVRGRGLMQGLLLSFDATKLVELLLQQKVIANAASGSVLRLVPPLIISNDDVDLFSEKLEICLKK